MSIHVTPYDHLNGFYRPGLSLAEQLVATTVGHEELLDSIRKHLQDFQNIEEKKNLMIMGPPGVGKTHFIRVIAEIVQKDKGLAKDYVVIQFPEENHRILTFSDMLLGVIELLNQISSEKRWQQLYHELTEIEDDSQLIEKALPELENYYQQKQKRLLILLENIDVFFKGQLKDNSNVNQFRKFITKSPFATFIGTSQFNLLKTDELRKAPFNLFEIHILEVLDKEQTIELIRKYLDWDQQSDLLKSFDELRPRLEALYEMSGGNPRLSLILYELISKESRWDIKRQIEKLLDQTTPFFRVRMKSLAPQERALLETIALMKIENKTATSIAKSLRQSSQQTTSHLNKLLKAGYLIVTDHPQDKRAKIYRIKEGFFGLWLAIGHSREQNTILPRLVEFLEQWYAEKSARARKRQQIWNSLKANDAPDSQIQIDNQVLLLKYLSDIGEKEEKAQSKFELVFYLLSIANRKEAKKLMREIYGLRFEKPLYFHWMLKQCRNWILGHIGPVALQQMEDILQCWKLLTLNEIEEFTELALNLAHSFHANGYYDLIVSFIEDLLKKVSEPRSTILLLERVAASQEKLRRWNDALNSWNQVLSAAQQSGDLKAQGTIMNNISQIYQDLGENHIALEFLTKSLDILKKINDLDGQGTTLNNISTIYFEQGYYEKALEHLEHALSVSKAARNRYIEGISLSNISLIYQARGDFERALEFLTQSLDKMKQIGNRTAECVALNNISQIHLESGNYNKSFDLLQTAISVAKEDQNLAGLGLSLYNRGKLYLQTKKEKEAMDDLVYAYQIAQNGELMDIIDKMDNLAETMGENKNTFWKNKLKAVHAQETNIKTSELL